MYEHRYREKKLHGVPGFPLYIYKEEHQAGVRSILPVHCHNEMEIIYLSKVIADICQFKMMEQNEEPRNSFGYEYNQQIKKVLA